MSGFDSVLDPTLPLQIWWRPAIDEGVDDSGAAALRVAAANALLRLDARTWAAAVEAIEEAAAEEGDCLSPGPAASSAVDAARCIFEALRPVKGGFVTARSVADVLTLCARNIRCPDTAAAVYLGGAERVTFADFVTFGAVLTDVARRAFVFCAADAAVQAGLLARRVADAEAGLDLAPLTWYEAHALRSHAQQPTPAASRGKRTGAGSLSPTRREMSLVVASVGGETRLRDPRRPSDRHQLREKTAGGAVTESVASPHSCNRHPLPAVNPVVPRTPGAAAATVSAKAEVVGSESHGAFHAAQDEELLRHLALRRGILL
jgi:hypothetical protein